MRGRRASRAAPGARRPCRSGRPRRAARVARGGPPRARLRETPRCPPGPGGSPPRRRGAGCRTRARAATLRGCPRSPGRARSRGRRRAHPRAQRSRPSRPGVRHDDARADAVRRRQADRQPPRDRDLPEEGQRDGALRGPHAAPGDQVRSHRRRLGEEVGAAERYDHRGAGRVRGHHELGERVRQRDGAPPRDGPDVGGEHHGRRARDHGARRVVRRRSGHRPQAEELDGVPALAKQLEDPLADEAVELVPVGDECEARALRTERVQRPADVPHQREGAHRQVVGRVLEALAPHDGHDRIERRQAPLEQAEPLLDLEQAAHRGVEPRRRDPTARDRGDEGADRRVGVRRDHEQIRPREEGTHGGFARAVLRDGGAHVERVGDDEALKPEGVAQQAGQDGRREGRRLLGAGEVGDDDVRAHHDVRPGGDPGPEGDEFERIQPSVARGDAREADVGVDLGVAVTGKMFQGGEHPMIAQPAHVLRHETRDRTRIFAEGPGIDDGVRRVVVDVGVGREIDVDADRPPLGGGGRADRVGVARIRRGADRHDHRERGGADEPHPGTPLEVGRNEERQPGAELQGVELGRDVERRAREHREAADLERVDPPPRHLEQRVVERGVGPREPGDDELADLLARREGAEQRIDGDWGRGVRGRSARPPDRRTAGTSEHGREYQEPMRPHLLSLSGLLTGAAPAAGQVRPGIEVLLSDSAHLLAGQRLALLTNQTGVDREGRRDVDRLLAGGYRLLVLLSPEHGFRGTEDRPRLPDAVDTATGLPIYSLYTTPRPPNFAVLDSVDVVVIDLQDIGARYYSYPAAAVLLMREAARRGRRVVVADRPNPIGGVVLQGNVQAAGPLDAERLDFLPLPMRHGLTLGEILRLANERYQLHAELVVVPAAGWRRGAYYDATGLPWVKPSPNMPDLESALHYPGTCLFEATNLSVGRGTGFAFQVVGAPWLDAAAVLRRVRDGSRGTAAGLAGVELTATRFTPRAPTDGKYDGVELPGVRLRVIDRSGYDPTRVAVALLAAIRGVHPDSLRFRGNRFDRLAGGVELRQALLAGRAPAAIWGSWERALERFRRERGKYLLY